MKDFKLTITINRPVAEVFVFTINPKNTPVILDGLRFTDSVVVPQMDNAKFAAIIHDAEQRVI